GLCGASAMVMLALAIFFFSSRRRHTRLVSDWSSDVCSSDLLKNQVTKGEWVMRGIDPVDAAHHPLAFGHLVLQGARFGVVQVERSEERRVGKEGRWRWGAGRGKQEESTQTKADAEADGACE